jgi:hypothetical protein
VLHLTSAVDLVTAVSLLILTAAAFVCVDIAYPTATASQLQLQQSVNLAVVTGVCGCALVPVSLLSTTAAVAVPVLTLFTPQPVKTTQPKTVWTPGNIAGLAMGICSSSYSCFLTARHHCCCCWLH